MPKDMAYLKDGLFWSYIHDMKIVQEYAKWNRIVIADTIIERMGWGWNRCCDFETIHNYIDIDSMILRKGAVDASLGRLLIIPINMRDGSLICRGKGNPDWNYSAPHGAGRLFGREAAKKEFSVEQFKESMNGIYTTSVGADTLDECPMAYKSMDDIVSNIGDTVDILKVIKPVYNFKAGNQRGEAMNKYKQLRYDCIDAYIKCGIYEHPERQMKKLGYKVIASVPQSIADQWWFTVEEIIYPLPMYLTEMSYDFEKWHGVNKQKGVTNG